MSETKKLNILIVEDDPNRYRIFDKIFEHHDVTKATTAERGVALFKQRDFDLVMLDHDLGHYDRGVPIDDGTGQQVAHCIATSTKRPTVVVHSWNPDGGAAICAILASGAVPHHRIWFSETIGHDLRTFGIIPDPWVKWEREA